MSDEGFLSRWAQRKARARRESTDARMPAAGDAVGPAPGAAPPTSTAEQDRPEDEAAQRAAPQQVPAGGPAVARDGALHPDRATGPAGGPLQAGSAGSPVAAEALPALDSITPADDFTPFMRVGVDASTRNAALRTLFSDPHFNVMDGLDIYIDDYSKPSPMSAAMLRSLRQSQVLGLLDDEPDDGLSTAGPPQGVPGAADSERASFEPAEAAQDSAAEADRLPDQRADTAQAHDGQPAGAQAISTEPAALEPADTDARSGASGESIGGSADRLLKEPELTRSRQIGASLAGQTTDPRAPDPGTIYDAVGWPSLPAAGG